MNTFDYKENLGYILYNFKEMIETDEYFQDIRFEMKENGHIEIKKSTIVLGEISELYGWLSGECEIMTSLGKMKPKLNIVCSEDLKKYIKYLEENCQSNETDIHFDTSDYLWLYNALKEVKDSGVKFDFKEISHAQLVELSWNQNLSDTFIGELYDVGHKSVYNKRAKWKLQIRNIPFLHEFQHPRGDIERVLNTFPVLKESVTTKQMIS